MPTVTTQPIEFRFRGDSGKPYSMRISARGIACTCPYYEWHRRCKHEERARAWLQEHAVTFAPEDIFARFER